MQGSPSVLRLVVFSCLVVGAACRSGNRAPVASITVEDAAQRINSNRATPVDVNSPETRARYGTLANAILLPDSEAFALSVLPSNKQRELIFYCGGPGCPSSHVAAKVARAGGHPNVFVMKEGISGWVTKGNAVVR